jgi:16S rRNA (adenine1518-N6/adenine1519-N6)-dimethyltransferase
MASPSDDRKLSPGDILRELGITPSKALGQHFLHDRKIVQRIVRESGVGPDDTVLEIGPGLGILTRELAGAVRSVVAIERDNRLATALENAIPNVTIVEADALAVYFDDVMGTLPYHVVANLPYSVGTAIIQRMQEARNPPRTLTLMLQREVAERIVAAPPDMNLLATGVQFHGAPKLLFRIGKGAFVPPPNVQSAVIRIVTHDTLPVSPEHRDTLFRIIRAGFSQPRKQLINNIGNGLGFPRDTVLDALHKADIAATVRPERLDVQDWVNLYHVLVADSANA